MLQHYFAMQQTAFVFTVLIERQLISHLKTVVVNRAMIYIDL